MIGIVIVTNGNLGQEMLVNAEQIVGRLKWALSVPVTDGEYRFLKDRICEAVSQVDTGSGVIVITDVQGSSSFNLCEMACSGSDHVIISGVNMPMLLKLAKVRRMKLPEAAKAVAEAGRKYITVLECD